MGSSRWEWGRLHIERFYPGFYRQKKAMNYPAQLIVTLFLRQKEYPMSFDMFDIRTSKRWSFLQLSIAWSNGFQTSWWPTWSKGRLNISGHQYSFFLRWFRPHKAETFTVCLPSS